MSPLYSIVKSTIRSRITGHEYRPGQKIPSEAELTREFDVSAITVRRALRDLTVEGHLIGRQGVGVFVTNQPKISRSLNPEYTATLGDEIRRAGFMPSIKELSIVRIKPEEAVASMLKISAKSTIYRHEKLILADGKPICLDVTMLPAGLGKNFANAMKTEFVLPLLQKHRIYHEIVDYRIEAASATEREANLIEIQVGAPLLVVRYCPVGSNGRPILVGHMLARAELFAFEFRVPPAKKTLRNRL